MRQALEALELSNANHWWGSSSVEKAITALKAALADNALDKMAENAREIGLDYEPAQQEPVGYWQGEFSKDGGATLYEVPQESVFGRKYRNIALYDRPQAREWVGLTDEEIMAIGRELGLKCRLGGNSNIDFDYARAIEAAHGITGEKK